MGSLSLSLESYLISENYIVHFEEGSYFGINIITATLITSDHVLQTIKSPTTVAALRGPGVPLSTGAIRKSAMEKS